MRDRMAIEEKFGLLGSGQQAILVNHHVYLLHEILDRLALGYEDIKPIDAFDLGDNHYAIRYFDFEERLIIVYEFDSSFNFPRL